RWRRRLSSVVGARAQLVFDPAADGIVTAGEVVGVVGVEALDALSRAADASGGSGPLVGGGDGGVALGGVGVVGPFDVERVDLALGLGHAAGRFESADLRVGRAGEEPVPGGHGAAVVEDGVVADDERVAGDVVS